MQRCTVKLAYQPGKKLGLVLIDAPVADDAPGTGSDDDDPDAPPPAAAAEVRGGGGTGSAAPWPVDVKEAAAAAARFARAALPPGAHKRKRTTFPCLSHRSPIFHLTERLRASGAPACELESRIDAALDAGRPGYNGDSLKCALARAIRGGDVVERIQHARVGAATTGGRRFVPAPCRRHRRARPYFRADHYTTFHCAGRSAVEVADILKTPANYPLYITFKRQSPVDGDVEGSADDCDDALCRLPPRKRLKTGNGGHVPQGISHHSYDRGEVISLLESSDEEEGDTGDGQTGTAGVDQENMGEGHAGAGDWEMTAPRPTTARTPPAVPPDPRARPLLDEEFVLTPFGPGKILAARVERYARAAAGAAATLFHPTIVYTVDLDYATCHVPAGQVTAMPGSACARDTLLTYQKVPLTEHDLLRLRPLTYLNDSIVMFYLKYLKAQLERDNGRGKTPTTGGRSWDELDGEGVHVFPSFCYTRIKNAMGHAHSGRNSKALRAKIWDDLKTWTKGTDLFKKKLLIFPINENLHWTCVCVCHPGRLVRRFAKDLAGKTGAGASQFTTHPHNSAVNTANGAGASRAVAEPPDVAGHMAHGAGASRSNTDPKHLAGQTAQGAGAPRADTDPPELAGHAAQGADASRAAAAPTASVPGETAAASSGGEATRHAPGGRAEDAAAVAAAATTAPATAQDASRASAPPQDVAGNTAHGAGAPRSDATPAVSVPGEAAATAPGGATQRPSPSHHRENSDAVTSAATAAPAKAPEELAGNTAEGAGASRANAGPTASVPGEAAAASSGGEAQRHAPRGRAADAAAVAAAATIAPATAKDASRATANLEDLAGKTANGSSASRANATPAVSVPRDVTATPPGGAAQRQSQSNHQENSAAVSSAATTAPAQAPRERWQCDFCKAAYFDDYAAAAAHERVCDANVDWCMLHFDSGRGFRLHKTAEMTGNVRKYLNAYADHEYAASHPGLVPFTAKNLPGFAARVPQQENTKDCGVYMLENAERMLRTPPAIDRAFVRDRGRVGGGTAAPGRPPAARPGDRLLFRYDKRVIERKRDDVLQLVRTLQRGEQHVE